MYIKLRNLGFALALCSNLTLFCPTVHAETAAFVPSKDNTLYESATGSSSNGSGPYFFVGKNGRGQTQRGVIAFDIHSLPSGSTITGATLTLHLSMTLSDSIPLALYRLTKDWGEGASSSTAGNGTTAAAGDATWIHTFYSSQFWTTPGGDFAATASASQNVAFAGASYTWGSTAGMVADIQQWLDTPATNFGWIVMGGEDASSTAKRFDSREIGSDPETPKLTVTYTLPASLSGTVTLQGIVSFAPAQVLTFVLHPSDNSGDKVKTASVAPNGTFLLSGVPRKNYSVRIKGDRYLAAKVNSVDASGGNVSGITALLKAGDGNNDNAVDVADLLLIINHYNKTQGSSGYLDACDFNLDGANDVADLLTVIGSYNQIGQ